VFEQGVYHNDERDGPGLLCHPDGRCDVGLWKRHHLVRMCSAADRPFAMSELGYDATPNPVDRPAAWKLDRVVRGRREILDRCGACVAPPPFQYPGAPGLDELAAAVLSDILPPTCLASDLKALDDAFIAADDYSALNVLSTMSPHVDTQKYREGSVLEEFSSIVVLQQGSKAALDTGGSRQRQVGKESSPDAQSVHGGSSTLPGVPDVLPQQLSTSSKVEGKTSVDGGATKQHTTKDHIDAVHPQKPSIRTGAETAGSVTEGEVRKQPRLLLPPTTVLAGVDAALRGDLGGGTVDLDLDPQRPGPLQLMSDRLINSAGRGHVDTVVKSLEDGLVSADVADSTGLTALMAASVCNIHMILLRFAFLARVHTSLR